jgi:hypothetical protein
MEEHSNPESVGFACDRLWDDRPVMVATIGPGPENHAAHFIGQTGIMG